MGWHEVRADRASGGQPVPTRQNFGDRNWAATAWKRVGSWPLLGCAIAVALSSAAAGQPSSTTLPRIGLLAWSSCEEASLTAVYGPFFQGLKDKGYKPGETLLIECRTAGRSYKGLAAAARELVQIRADVIVSNSQPSGQAAAEATDEIPIVTIVSGDPVTAGLARSLATPGGNLTGLSYYATELTAKRLELLKEMVPDLVTVGVLANPNVSYLPFEEDTKRAADRLAITLSVHHVSEPDELSDAFAKMKMKGAQAAFVLPDLMFASAAQHIAELAMEHRLPTMAWGDWFAKAGCLMAYSSDYGEMVYRLAHYVDLILKGAPTSEIPIEQPTKFKLSINLASAKAIGVDVPQTLLLLADELIE